MFFIRCPCAEADLIKTQDDGAQSLATLVTFLSILGWIHQSSNGLTVNAYSGWVQQPRQVAQAAAPLGCCRGRLMLLLG